MARFPKSLLSWRRLLAGFGLVAGLWLLTAFVAFGLFDRDTAAAWVIGLALLVFAIVVALLAWRGLLGWLDGAWAGVAVAILAGLYLVPLRSDLPADALDLIEELDARHDDRHDFARELFHDLAGRPMPNPRATRCRADQGVA